MLFNYDIWYNRNYEALREGIQTDIEALRDI